MARYTLEAVSASIFTLSAQETVYKVEVDTAKFHLSNVYDSSRKGWGERFTHAGKWQSLTEEERKVEPPYELRHMYGKKFSTALDAAPKTPAMDALRDMKAEFQPVYDELQTLIARQVKGRMPVVKEVVGTRTQLRAICPCCFREQAVNNGRMVAHGYTIEYGFQNGNCAGKGAPHFGTIQGREVCRQSADALHEMAEGSLRRAAAVAAGTAPVFRRSYQNRSYQWVEVKEPSYIARREYAETLRWEAEQIERNAKQLYDAVTNWKPKDPVEVQVEVTK